ncbi:MAG: TonB-dependent receptor [Burkholderiales bacterium]|nr:TonB-dependent receptor [Burkholderiales bacterium]
MELRVYPLALAVASACASVAHAQGAGAGSQQQPPAASAGPEPLAPVVVTANPIGSNLFELANPATVLSGPALRRRIQPTLGETLNEEVGVTSTYFGPNASRPIIRGLGEDRIVVLQNGASVLDASSISPDHAVALEPLLMDRVEIVRGPAAVMYGGNAVGGVVNVTDGRIAQEGLPRPATGAADLRYDSVANERAGAARVDVGNDRFVLHADGFARKSDDLRIPGEAWTPYAQSVLGAPGPSGRLPNSNGNWDGGAVAGSAILANGYVGAAYSNYSSRYGTPADENVRIRLDMNRFDFAGELRDPGGMVRALKWKVGYTDYQHQETENGVVGTTFKSRGWDGRAELLHEPLGGFTGALGVQFTDADLSALGDEAFLPSTKTTQLAGFVYEETALGPVKLSAGARLATVSVDAQAFAQAGLPADSRRFTPWSAALGAVWTLAKEYALSGNVSYTERAPTGQELYANGPHLATNAFEIGDRSLDVEKSLAFDVGLRKTAGRFTGYLGWFYNRFTDFIALTPSVDPATGQPLYRDLDDRSVPATTDPATLASPIPQYAFVPVPATFQGLEASARAALWSQRGRAVDLELRADYVRATDRSNGSFLPRIPPLRVGGAVVYTAGDLYARADVLWAADQHDVAPGEQPTDGYTLVNAAVGYKLRALGAGWEAFVRGTNLLNESIRYTTSFLKEIAPAGARAVIVGVRGAF